MTADASRLRAALERWGAGTQDRAGDVTVGLVRATGQVPIKSGQLRGSIRRAGTENRGSRFVVTVVAPVIQAATTDKGARPHPIVPRRAGGLLVFHWPKAGGVVFLRRVNHPGNPPDPWWQEALERAYRQALPLAARTTPFR